jgi:hypothetical protein
VARTIIVGDVHGCSAELRDLLDVAAVSAADRLVFVGDLVARGPDSRGVLRLVRELGARSVVGNHELELRRYRAATGGGHGVKRPGRSHRELADELSREDWELIGSLPPFLELPEHGVVVVHAGLVPGRAPGDHDDDVLTNLRCIDTNGRPTHRLEGTLWAALYRGPPHVVFGHDALRSIQVHRDATGLDSGCVYGGRLTALVLPAAQSPPPAAERLDAMVSVPARRQYYFPERKRRKPRS